MFGSLFGWLDWLGLYFNYAIALALVDEVLDRTACRSPLGITVGSL